MEAQRFPDDYDGILAGAPALDWTHLVTGNIDAEVHLISDPKNYISTTKLPAITAAVMEACDAADGLRDGITSDPQRCRFNPAVLLCKGSETRNCLTAPQIESLRRLYEGTKERPGFVPGGESLRNGRSAWIIGPGPGGASSVSYLENYLRYMVYDDPKLNLFQATTTDAVARVQRKTAEALDATNPDLDKFRSRGGKLILYHGWGDPAISPFYSIRYYNAVVAHSGQKQAADFVRLYMVPAMSHCYGGSGPSAFGQLGIPTIAGSKYGLGDAMEAWVEEGTPPGSVTVTKYVGDKTGMTRPLCAYPKVARYNGNGDPSEASSFQCESTQP